MIRFLIKLALFPVTLILTLLVAFARFFCLFSGMVLNVIAGALFLFGVLMLFIGEWHGFLGFAVLAWAISPLWAAGGGCLANRTSGRYKQYAKGNLTV